MAESRKSVKGFMHSAESVSVTEMPTFTPTLPAQCTVRREKLIHCMQICDKKQKPTFFK